MPSSAADQHSSSSDDQKEQSHADTKKSVKIERLKFSRFKIVFVLPLIVCGRYAHSTEDTLEVRVIDLRFVSHPSRV